MTKKYYNLTLSAFMLTVTIVFLVAFAGAAWPASLRICFEDNPDPSISTAPAFINTNPLWPDLLAGSVLGIGGTVGRCNVIPIPATVLRGIDQTVTMKYANTLGEVSTASNGKTFRLPTSPPVPVINSVAIVAP